MVVIANKFTTLRRNNLGREQKDCPHVLLWVGDTSHGLVIKPHWLVDRVGNAHSILLHFCLPYSNKTISISLFIMAIHELKFPGASFPIMNFHMLSQENTWVPGVPEMKTNLRIFITSPSTLAFSIDWIGCKKYTI